MLIRVSYNYYDIDLKKTLSGTSDFVISVGNGTLDHIDVREKYTKTTVTITDGIAGEPVTQTYAIEKDTLSVSVNGVWYNSSSVQNDNGKKEYHFEFYNAKFNTDVAIVIKYKLKIVNQDGSYGAYIINEKTSDEWFTFTPNANDIADAVNECPGASGVDFNISANAVLHNTTKCKINVQCEDENGQDISNLMPEEYKKEMELNKNDSYSIVAPVLANYECTSKSPVTGTIKEEQLTIIFKYKLCSYNYRVEYYYDNTDGDPFKEVKETAQYGTAIPYVTDAANLPSDVTFAAGYKRTATDVVKNGDGKVTTDVNSNVIKVVFTKNSYDYQVEYYYDNTDTTAFKKVTGSGAYGTAIPYVTEAANLPKDVTFAPGYKTTATSVVNGDGRVTDNGNCNIIKVVFTKDSFGYQVEYYYDNTDTTAFKTVTGSAKYGTAIPYVTEAAHLPKDVMFAPGYKTTATSVVNGDGRVTDNGDCNIVKVIFTKDSFGYQVEYYYDNTDTTAFKKVTDSAQYGTAIPYATEAANLPGGVTLATGYKTTATSVENENGTVTENAANNVVKVVFTKDSFGYQVEYYYDNTDTTAFKKVTDSAQYGTAIPYATEAANLPEDVTFTPGYNTTATSIINENGTVTEKPENNIVKVVFTESQVEIRYEINPTLGLSLGTLSNTSTGKINAVTGDPDGSTVTTLTGATFINWTDASGNFVSEDVEFTPSRNKDGVYESATYYANFKINIVLTANSMTAFVTGSSISVTGFTAATASSFDMTTITFGESLTAGATATGAGTYPAVLTNTNEDNHVTILSDGEDISDYFIIAYVNGNLLLNTVFVPVPSPTPTPIPTVVIAEEPVALDAGEVLGVERNVVAEEPEGEVLGERRGVQTGDAENAFAWAIILFASVTALGGYAFIRYFDEGKKRRK